MAQQQQKNTNNNIANQFYAIFTEKVLKISFNFHLFRLI